MRTHCCRRCCTFEDASQVAAGPSVLARLKKEWGDHLCAKNPSDQLALKAGGIRCGEKGHQSHHSLNPLYPALLAGHLCLQLIETGQDLSVEVLQLRLVKVVSRVLREQTWVVNVQPALFQWRGAGARVGMCTGRRSMLQPTTAATVPGPSASVRAAAAAWRTRPTAGVGEPWSTSTTRTSSGSSRLTAAAAAALGSTAITRSARIAPSSGTPVVASFGWPAGGGPQLNPMAFLLRNGQRQSSGGAMAKSMPPPAPNSFRRILSCVAMQSSEPQTSEPQSVAHR